MHLKFTGNAYSYPSGWDFRAKLFVMVKFTTFLVFVTCLQISARGYAQMVTLSAKNATLESVIQQIKSQTGYSFFYNESWLGQAKPVTVEVNDVPVKKALNMVFRSQPFGYHMVDKIIVLKWKVPAAVSPRADTVVTIHGRIKNEEGGAFGGVTISIAGTQEGVISDVEGRFSLQVSKGNVITVSAIGYNALSFRVISVNPFQFRVVSADRYGKNKAVSPKDLLASMGAASKENVSESHVVQNADKRLLITLAPYISSLNEIAVLSTGYQILPKERATGSFVQIDNNLISRSVSTNILDRLDGIASGVFFTESSAFSSVGGIFTGANSDIRGTGILIRGISTLSPAKVGTDPLIILDNFPYKGDLRNINPNDVASVTILKDAAAASIWGAHAGNGVIVITTKKGNKNHKPVIDFNSSITIADKPDIFYDRNYLDASDYIDVEIELFNQGYFNSDLNNTSNWPVVSPLVEILAAERSGILSEADAIGKINLLRNLDVRDDFEKYVYQKVIKRQYSLGVRGGGRQMAYALSVGLDNNRDGLVRAGESRLTLNANNTYTPVKNLDITTGINYSQTLVKRNNQLGYGNVSSGGKYGLIPYALLAGPGGTPLAIPKGFRMSYIDSIQQLGFLDQHYQPLDEIRLADYTSKINDLVLKASVTYHFGPNLSAMISYQNERQVVVTRNDKTEGTYSTNSMINEYAQYDRGKKSFKYPFPLGDVLTIGNTTLKANNIRAQLNYAKTFNHKHVISAIAGAEINESTAQRTSLTSLGYDGKFGTSVSDLNYNISYPTNPNGSRTINSPGTDILITTYRYISYFANAGYTYDNRYTATVSGRKDGANIFGVKTNDRITPLWSAGLGWVISNEKFYHSGWLPYLKLRLSYGFNGNVYNGSAFTTGIYTTSFKTGLPQILNLTAPNPNLSWEKVKNINIGIDFVGYKNILKGTIEFYQKDGEDLIETIPLAASTGFTYFNGNAASTRTNGIDITITSNNINRRFKWSTTALLSYLHDKVTKYGVTQTSSSIQMGGGVALLGKPIYGIFSYKWAGLDPADGGPQGYLNGKVSENYTDIINNYNPDSLVFNGSALPTLYGSLRNDLSYKGFSLSFNIIYKLGYYFRRPSVNLNYQDVLKTPNMDYKLRWQKPGDEKNTSVPSLVYPSNQGRNTFYRYSSVLVEKAGNIRLQDIRFSYDFTREIWHEMPFSVLQAYTYASNIGLLWKANQYGLDPDAVPSGYWGHALPAPFSIAFGLKVTF